MNEITPFAQKSVANPTPTLDLDFEEVCKFIDPKNPHTVGTSAWNLGNHTLAICFILCLVFVVYASYK